MVYVILIENGMFVFDWILLGVGVDGYIVFLFLG